MSLMSASEVQKILGFGKTTFYNYQKLGMPYTEVGRKKLYDIDNVQEWLATRKSNLHFDQLQPNKDYTSEEIKEIFKVSPQGGMRSNAVNRVMVLLSDHTGTGLYEDYIKDDILYYTGTGRQGDQEYKGANKTLRDSNKNSYKTFLFESYKENIYTYRGQVVLAGDPFLRDAKDELGEMRKVIMFPLKLVDKRNLLDAEKLQAREQTAKQHVKALDKRKLIDQVVNTPDTHVSEVVVKTKRFIRDEKVKYFAKQRANGFCELCGQPAPFTVNGEPFLEVHHIHPLSEGGQDSYENVAALCPNCHRRIHFLDDKEDQEKLRKTVSLNNEKFCNQNYTAISRLK